MQFIAGQIFSRVASMFMLLSGIQKTHKKIMLFQVMCSCLGIIGHFLLGGYAAVITTAATLLRNTLSYFNKLNIKATLGIIGLIMILTFILNDMGRLLNWLPLLSCIPYTVALNFSNYKVTKIVLLYATTLTTIYLYAIQSYPTFVVSLMNSITLAISIIKENNEVKIELATDGEDSQ